jgi:hypothetical protein
MESALGSAEGQDSDLESGVVSFICTFLEFNKIREIFERAFLSFSVYDSHWMVPSHATHSWSEGAGASADPPEQLKASQKLWALCAMKEGNIYFGPEVIASITK